MSFKNRIIKYGDEPIDEILFNPDNFRIHPRDQQEAVEGLVEEVGWAKPIIINLRTSELWGADRNVKTLVDGADRCTMAAQHGEKTIPAAYIDVEPEAERMLIIGLDATAAMAGTDREKLSVLIAQINTESEKLKAFFDSVIETQRLDEFYNAGVVEEDEARPEDADAIQAEWQVKTGQLWEIPSNSVMGGVHRIVCGDSTDPALYDRLMGDDKARMVWTDPPYGVNYAHEKADPRSGHRERKPIKNDDLSADKLTALIRTSLQNCAAHSIEGGSVYMASPSGTMMPALIDSFDNSGYDWHWLLVWVKDAMVLSRGDYHMRHENILYGWMHGGTHYFTSDRTQTSVFEYPRPKKSDEHPTMKPVGLVAHHIKNSSRESEIVIDPFSGSGTTMAACERVRRINRAIELAPEYVAVTLQRMSDLGLTPKLVE